MEDSIEENQFFFFNPSTLRSVFFINLFEHKDDKIKIQALSLSSMDKHIMIISHNDLHHFYFPISHLESYYNLSLSLLLSSTNSTWIHLKDLKYYIFCSSNKLHYFGWKHEPLNLEFESIYTIIIIEVFRRKK